MEAGLTHTLALWGAITGTIGTIAGIANLILRFKQYNKDQPKLVCSSKFTFEHSAGIAHPQHKLIIRAVGKRPVTLDYVRYFIKPKGFWSLLFKQWIWSKNRWIYDDKPISAIQITEGKKEEIRISMPNGLSIQEIVKVEIHDQSGKAWKVKWPSAKKLGIEVQHEQLHKSEESNSERLCKVSGYTAAGDYYINVQWNPTSRNKNALTGKLFHLQSEKEYKSKLQEIIEFQQPKILACELDEIG